MIATSASERNSRHVPRDARDFESGVDRDVLNHQSDSRLVFDNEQAHGSSFGGRQMTAKLAKALSDNRGQWPQTSGKSF
ncbi:hypothetical protein AOG23_29820 [Rhizobium acidisoli]|nr:hypothetical protein AOG23_29820 [Rhizobium acidisoli]